MVSTFENSLFDEVWIERLSPASVAALSMIANDAPVGDLSDVVRLRIEQLGPRFVDDYFALFGIGSREVAAATSDGELEDLGQWVSLDTGSLVDAAHWDSSSPALVYLTLEVASEADLHVEEGKPCTFAESVLTVLALPGERLPRTVDDLMSTAPMMQPDE